jgi:predicted RNase H-like HicB family nuclease
MIIRGYHVDLQKLSRDLGGGYVAFAPKLKGCLADGETPVQAAAELDGAIECWLEVASNKGWSIPPADGEPGGV